MGILPDYIGTLALQSLVLLTLVLIARSIYLLYFHPLHRVPGPLYCAVSHLPYLYQANISGKWIKHAEVLHRRYGHLVRIGPDHIALDGSLGWSEVFAYELRGAKEFSKTANFVFFGDDAGILAASQDRHRQIRRQLGHVFSKSALSRHESVITHQIHKLIAKIAAHTKNEQCFEVVTALNCMAFDLISRIGFSYQASSQDGNELPKRVTSAFLGIRASAVVRFFTLSPLAGICTQIFNIHKDKHSNSVASEVLMNRVAELDESRISGDKRDVSFLSYLLKRMQGGSSNMNTQELQATSVTIGLAGTETMTTGLSGLIFNIAANPEAHNNLAKEVRSAFKSAGDITAQSTSKLAYLEACVKESLRIYPAAPEMPPRICPGAYIQGNYIPAGTYISVYPYATFRNPDHFVEPEHFRPERWLTEDHPKYNSKFSNENKAAYKPFSYGARDCIGKNLAYMEMQLFLALIIFRFNFRLAPDQDQWRDSQLAFMVWQKSPLRICFEEMKPIEMGG